MRSWNEDDMVVEGAADTSTTPRYCLHMTKRPLPHHCSSFL